MIIPKFTKNGTIGFIAPSFGCNMEPYRSAFESALKQLSDKGHTLVLGPNVYEGSGVGISNTPSACGEEVNEFFTAAGTDAIISCGGGELMCEILDHIDFDAIKEAKPQWFMGYSDNTNLTFLLPTICDIAAIYGPNAPAFGMEPWHPAIEDAYEVLIGQKTVVSGYSLWEKTSLKTPETPLEPYHVTEPVLLRTNSDTSIRMEGRLLGGCLDCLGNLVGTGYDHVKEFNERYKQDGVIWFLESCELNLMSIRRTLWQLAHAGWFEQAKGFLIGRPGVYGAEEFGINHYDAYFEALKEFNVPIVMDTDIGHLPPMMPLVCGAMAKVSVEDNKIEVAMDLS